MARYFGADKLVKLMNYVQQNGGIRASLRKLYRLVKKLKKFNYATINIPWNQTFIYYPFSSMDEMKAGSLVGADKYGNKYFEDPTQFYGRNRWVEFSDHKNLEYDASQIPAEWYGWMHYKVMSLKNV